MGCGLWAMYGASEVKCISNESEKRGEERRGEEREEREKKTINHRFCKKTPKQN